MSRSYTYKPELKRRMTKPRIERRVRLADYEIEFIEEMLGPNVKLRF